MADIRQTPTAEAYTWQNDAACREVDASLFFHPEGERGAARQARLEAAREVCGRCAVRAECLAWALERPEPYGIWGGLDEDERQELLTRQRVVVNTATAEAEPA